MGPIEIEYDYLPDSRGVGSNGEQAASDYERAAFGVVLELALQAAQYAGVARSLYALRFGPELVLDRALRCVAHWDPEHGRLRVSSSDLAAADSARVHLSAELEPEPGGRGASSSTRVQLGAPVVRDAMPQIATVDPRKPLRSLVTALALYEHGLEAELADTGGFRAYAVHPWVSASGFELVRLWLGHERKQQPLALGRAACFELIEPGARVVRLRVLRAVDPGSERVARLDVLAESSGGIAWRLLGLELELADAASSGAMVSGEAAQRGALMGRLRALPAPARRGHCEAFLRELIRTALGRDAALEPTVPLRDLGLSSRAAVELASALADALGQPLAPTLVFEHPTLASLATLVLALASGHPVAPATASAPARVGARPRAEAGVASDVAVIGMACRLPGGIDSPAGAWELMRCGRDVVGAVPAERVALAPAMSRHTLPGGFLSGIEQFDAAFFAVGEREAAAMDPQHRLLLEVTWEALERAGIVPSALAGTRTGVFVSASPFGYAHLVAEPDAFTAIGNEPSAAAGRLAYFLGLRGPCMCVDAACASSLLAVCLASDSLRRGEIDLAIVGGVNLLLDPLVTDTLIAGGVLSSAANRCRAFDAAADGYVRSEACGVVVLRRADDAARAREPVLASIRGYAVNHSGRANGLGAPSREAQAEVIRLALDNAGVSAREVGYVEAHGTGTAVGDALELQAVSEVYGTASERTQPLLIGSLKTNIGHSEFAAGITGVIKAVLVAQRGEIPRHLHVRQRATAIDWPAARIDIASEQRAWPAELARRIVAVNALGISGTYAHLLLEAPVRAPEADRGLPGGAEPQAQHTPYVVALSAADEPALCALAGAYADHLAAGGEPARLATTSTRHRADLALRAAVVGDDAAELQAALRALAAGERPLPVRVSGGPKVAFLYSGFGGQHAGMGAALIARSPIVGAAIERCDRLLHGRLSCSLFDLLRPGPEAERLLRAAGRSQPAIFALQYALTELWRSWGVQPDIVMGHSLGELAASHTAGVLSLEDALMLVAERGRLMDTLPEAGAMAAVDAPRSELQALIDAWPGALWLAAVNAPNQLVISGTEQAVAEVSAQLERRGARVRRLAVTVPAHSGLLDPILDEFEHDAARASYRPASLPIVSTLSGARERDAMSSARYFRTQLREPVEFARGMEALLAEGVTAFVEVGPHPALIGPAVACCDEPDKLFVASMSRERDPLRQMLEAALELHAAGAQLSWEALPCARGVHDPDAPTYRFQRRRHWVRLPRAAQPVRELVRTSEPVLGAVAEPEPRLHQFAEHEAVARLERLIGEELRRLIGSGYRQVEDRERRLGELGLSSLGAVQLRSCLQRWVGVPLPISLVAVDKTARELAAEAWAHATRAA